MPAEQSEAGWDAVCDLPGCGGFTSRAHPTRKAAAARLAEHKAEHKQEASGHGDHS